MRCELGALKLILLDEVSMVGNSMFTVRLNNRLKDLKGSKDDFGGISIITLGDLFQLKPVMDGYVFSDVQCLNTYNILVPNLWRKYFKMFELDEIMRQRESKMFAEILNRLREGNHTLSDLEKLKDKGVLKRASVPQKHRGYLFKMRWSTSITIKFTSHSIVVINTQ